MPCLGTISGLRLRLRRLSLGYRGISIGGNRVSIGARIEHAIDLVDRAAFEPERWDEALLAVAAATGSKAGQLCAIGGPGTMAFNRLPGLDPDFLSEWSSLSFDHPAINSRIRIGMQAPVLRVMDERAFDTVQDGIDCPEYGEMLRLTDIPFICLTNLIRTPDEHVGFAVLRGSGQGNIEGEERRAFDHIARYVQRAVRTSLAFGLREARTLACGMHAIEVTAFICDAGGKVLATSEGADAMLAADPRLALRGGRLVETVRGRDLSMLAAGLRLTNLSVPIVIDADEKSLPLIAEFAPLPFEIAGIPGAPCSVITLRRAWAGVEARIGRQAVPLYELTPRETQVAIGLCTGRTPQQIADALTMGLGTVRTHIRRLFDKTGASNLAQLVAIFSAYGD